MADPVIVVPYDPEWPKQFRKLATDLRGALGEHALRIDHIGSTAIPQMHAKPILDVQISVEALEPTERYCHSLEKLGFVWRDKNPDKTKRYFREAPGSVRTHIHVRQAGSWSEQFALLFRDYLRAIPGEAQAYSYLKQLFAKNHALDRQAYQDAKSPHLWRIMEMASDWAQATGWQPGPPDA